MQILGCQSLSFKGFGFPLRHTRAIRKRENQEFASLPVIDAPNISDVFVSKKLEIRTIPDFVKFTPAKTIEEARKFAKENFLISQYELTDIDCANYVNEALSEYYNKNNTALPVVSSVLISPREEEGFATMNCPERILSVCEDRFKDIDSYLDRYLNSEIIKERCQNANKKCDLTKSQKKYFRFYKAGAKNYQKLPFKEKIGLLLFLRGFSGEILPNNANGKTALPDGGPFWIINHEIGHREHYKVSLERHLRLHEGFKKGMSRKEAKARFREIEPRWEVTFKVSDYASSKPVEFVAEVFACLQNGVKFDDDVMELYEKYGGPKIT